MDKFWDIVKIIFTTIVIILLFVSVVLIMISLLGHSPAETTIMFSVIGFLVALQLLIISILIPIKEDIGNIKEFKRQTISEINNVKNKLIGIDNRLLAIEKEH